MSRCLRGLIFGLAGSMLLLSLLVLAISCGDFETWTQKSGNPPRRLISTAPSITEILYQLDLEDSLVGVTTYCDYPPEARKKPKIGDFAAPNLEKILSLEPDLIIILSDRSDLKARFDAVDLKTLMIRQQSIQDILNSIRTIGHATGISHKSELVTQRLSQSIESLRERATDLSSPRVLLLVGRNPGSLSELYAVGGRSYLAELIRVAGGSGIFSDSSQIFPKVSIELILERDPEVIVDLGQAMDETGSRVAARRLWEQLSMVQAVKDGRVYFPESDVFLIPGPRIVEAAVFLFQMFHHPPPTDGEQ